MRKHTHQTDTQRKRLFGKLRVMRDALENRKKSVSSEDRTFKSSEESFSPTLWRLGLRPDGMVDWNTKAM